MRTFAGIPEKYSQYHESAVVLLPVPYDGTSTYGKGADKGPEAMLDAAENMELYDIETDSEVFRKGIYLAESIEEKSNPEQMVIAVHKAVEYHLNNHKFIGLFGGEHSVSIGSIRAFSERFPELTVLQLDAHSDMRPAYEGSPFNHACAMHEASKNCKLVQVGIRSMDASEKEFIDPDHLFTTYAIRENKYWKEDVVNLLGALVYVTIDLDVFDPSVIPSTGTPEPGGLYWNEILDLLKMVFRNTRVVGFDIVELAPKQGFPASDFNAAKLLYKILSYKFHLGS